MHREFIKRNVVAGLPKTKQFSDTDIEVAIDESIRVLSNLIHYNSGRSHYDDDIAFVARVLLSAVSQ